MNADIQRWSVVFGIIAIASWLSAQQGWLGPYGLAGDTYHLIILTIVLFIAYITVANALYLRGEPEA